MPKMVQNSQKIRKIKYVQLHLQIHSLHTYMPSQALVGATVYQKNKQW